MPISKHHSSVTGDSKRSWESAFLNLFADKGILTSEKRLQLGGLNYFLFSSQFELADGRICSCYGKDEDRVSAAVKCAAESIEREVMSRFFFTGVDRTAASAVTLTKAGLISEAATDVDLAPPGLRNSNGWAIQRSKELAETAAVREALERHLLLKSFIRFGWDGFSLVQEIEAEDATFYLMTSRYSCAGMTSGLVVAKSTLYSGISLGYCCGKLNEIGNADFWKTALYEAADKILLLKGREIKLSADSSWMTAEIKRLLEEPFDASALRTQIGTGFIEDSSISFYLKSWNVAPELKTDIPVFSAFVWGIDLLPLFPTVGLSEEAANYVRNILSRNDLAPLIPKRHPII
jgi:hypothetical protein